MMTADAGLPDAVDCHTLQDSVQYNSLTTYSVVECTCASDQVSPDLQCLTLGLQSSSCYLVNKQQQQQHEPGQTETVSYIAPIKINNYQHVS